MAGYSWYRLWESDTKLNEEQTEPETDGVLQTADEETENQEHQEETGEETATEVENETAEEQTEGTAAEETGEGGENTEVKNLSFIS